MMKNKEVYRLEGLSCTNCAAKFQDNVKSIPGVEDVTLNFGAAKLEVTGDASIEALEAAGKFDNIKVRPAHIKRVNKVPFYKKRENIPFILSAIIFLVGMLCSLNFGEDHTVTRAVFIIAILVGGYHLFIEGVKGLFKLNFDMNVLMTVAIIGAALIGELQEGAMVVVLFAISEALEGYAMEKSRAGIASLIDISPDVALIAREGKFIEVDVDSIMPGDIVKVLPGKKIPVDGVVTDGQSNINQASITGESIPVHKQEGDTVYSGTLNESGQLTVRVTKRNDETKLAQMIHLVEEAQSEKAPTQKFVDRFAKYYTPIIMLIALTIIVVPPLFGGDFNHYLYQGLSVLVVGCPCALVISTPVAIVTAIGRAAKEGMLIKGGVHLENAGHISTVAFDKTGTLTKGKPAVVSRRDFEADQKDDIIYTLEKEAGHPLSRAVVDSLEVRTLVPVTDYEVVTAKGVKGVFDGVEYRIGQRSFFDLTDDAQTEIENMHETGATMVLFGTVNRIYSVFFIKDTLREEAGSVIRTLEQMNIDTVMLTGDHKSVAETIGKEIGLTQVHAGLLPEDKLDIIKNYQQHGRVAMVGDGVNDAPALAQADVGFSMGGAATDTALETADIAFMKDNLDDLPRVIQLSKRTLKIIKQNITFALGLKLLAILLVIPGWLTLWIAIFADMGATILVTLNSLRLLKRK